LKICLVSAELTPYAKTGGLGDSVAGLARALARAGHDVRVFLPLYSSISVAREGLVPVDFARDVVIRSGPHEIRFTLLTAPGGGGPQIYFVDSPGLYGRAAIYTGQLDDAGRFAFLCRATLESCQRMGWGAEVFHCNDWHTALVPVYLRTHYAWDRLFQRAKTLLCIHNIGYQGRFDSAVIEDLDFAGHTSWFPQYDLASGSVNFLKAGLFLADALATVSPRHAQEIQTAEYGRGLEAILKARAGSLFGILNGVDDEWNPATDPWIAAPYDATQLEAKVENKRQLVESLGLPFRRTTPVLGVVSRLTKQKGIELMMQTLPELLSTRELQLVALGSGEAEYERFFADLQHRFAGKAVFYRGTSNELAHRIEAGADIFLMPSLYEPCGLNQMYSLRYGTIPVVRATGGLADSIRPYDWRTGEGTGFVFEHFGKDGFAWALDAALRTFEHPQAWRRLMLQGMAEDFSWERQAARYVELYRWLVER